MRFLMAGVSAPSHIFPSLAVIAELVRRGHEVRYVVGERHRALVEPTGATVVGTETIMPDADHRWPEGPGEAMQVFLDDAIATLPTIEALQPADAVLYDIGGFAGHEFYDTLKASGSGAHYFATLRGWLDEHHVDLDNDTFLGKPAACVVLIPKALQCNADRVSDRYVFAGPAIDESRKQGWTPPPGDQPLVYISFGTAYTDRADAPVGRARTRRRVRHARRHGRRERGTLVRRPGRRRAAGRGPVRERGHARGPGGGRAAGEQTAAEAVAKARECAGRARELRAQVRARGGVDKAADAVEGLTRR